jgi:WD40 repeat protein
VKKILPILFLIVFIVSCRGNAPILTVPTEQATPSTVPALNTAINTATAEPIATSTTVPPSPLRWYWGLDDITYKLFAVNQLGKEREIGSLELSDTLQINGFSLDAERVLFFTYDQNILHAYLLGLDDMQPIKLPDGFSLDSDNWSTLRVVGAYGDFAMLSYVTRLGSNLESEAGPVLLVNLKSLTAEQIDEYGNVWSLIDPRLYFHASTNGRYVRYVNGDKPKADIREVDLASGEVRTIHTMAEPYNSISASPQGDLWFLRASKIILDIDGNQKHFTEEDSFTFRPFEGKKGVIFPRDCNDNCELRVVSPFGSDAELKYTLPWAIEAAGYYELLSQFMPDQSLIFIGDSYSQLATTPAIVKDTPNLRDDDEPVFRLSPDGRSRIVGIYRSIEFAYDKIPISPDGRYFLLKSLDQTSFFIYDAVADSPLFSMPAYPDLDYLNAQVRFSDGGIMVHVNGTAADGAYKNFFHAYSYDLAKAVSWDAGGAQYADCEDILPDSSLICWTGAEPQHINLIRYDPASAQVTILQKDLGPMALP